MTYDESRRVVITGVGLLTPLGVGIEPTWNELLAGASAVGPIQGYDASSLDSQLGAEITGLRARDYVDRRALRTMTRHDMLAAVAAALAVKDSGLEFDDDPRGRYALFTASGKEISEPEHFEDVAVAVRDGDGTVDMQRFGELAFRQVAPLFYIEGLQGASLFFISDAFKLRGANTFFAGGAESGMIALGRGFRAVHRGEADLAIAGGADAPVNWWNMAKIDSLGIMTRRNELGAGACAPYDAERDGTVMGEGAGFLVLEEREAALARGARIYAEIAGFGSTSDVDHLLTPDRTGAPLGHAITHALSEAGHGPESVGFVATHGDGTVLGDASEARALRDAFGGNGGGPGATSVKPALGHLGAAAGAANVAIAALAIQQGRIPPTLNLHTVDPACSGIDWVTGEARHAPVDVALALARGLEGQNVALALRGANQEERT
jgi:3-oxoacyl-[acyl-carrier-protein] synthase II